MILPIMFLCFFFNQPTNISRFLLYTLFQIFKVVLKSNINHYLFSLSWLSQSITFSLRNLLDSYDKFVNEFSLEWVCVETSIILVFDIILKICLNSITYTIPLFSIYEVLLCNFSAKYVKKKENSVWYGDITLNIYSSTILVKWSCLQIWQRKSWVKGIQLWS